VAPCNPFERGVTGLSIVREGLASFRRPLLTEMPFDEGPKTLAALHYSFITIATREKGVKGAKTGQPVCEKTADLSLARRHDSS